MKKARYNDVLAQRYATPTLVNLWSAENKVVLERKLWVAALKAQADLGIQMPFGAIEAYEATLTRVDLESIRKREAITRHDVKAKIEEFNDLAGFELIHRPFTSRDLTDNTEQLQILESLKYVRGQMVAVMYRMYLSSRKYRILELCGRSHNVPAQVITLGKRFANWIQELLIAFKSLDIFISQYPLRGIKGPMGTCQDLMEFFGDSEKVQEFDRRMTEHLGFPDVLQSVGQVYPRSLDFAVTSLLVQTSSAVGSFATTLRILAGLEQAHEGFKDGQVGSSAMPHKVNSRTAERICGLVNVLNGYHDMTSRLVGDQWFEGDVSCSVVRRVALPDAFFALDGIFESAITIIDEMQIFPKMFAKEMERFLPFMNTTSLLTAAVKAGMGRETAHELIKRTAVSSVLGMREGNDNPFVSNLIVDLGLHVDPVQIEKLASKTDCGLSTQHVDVISAEVEEIMERFPAAKTYKPEPIL